MPDNTDIAASERPRRVMAIGLDSPNHDLLLRWIGEGRLPNLQRLQNRSTAVDVQSVKRFSNEHCWIPMLTGQSRERWNHWLDNWDAQTYQFNEASIFDWIQAPIFYALGDQCRVVAFDLTAPIVGGVKGSQVSGWASDLNECYAQSDPPELLQDLLERYGPDPKLTGAHTITNQLSHRQGISHTVPSMYEADVLREYAQVLMRSVDRRTAACLDLLNGESWELFTTLFSETHTGGHALWHLSQPHPLNSVREGAEDPLLDLYQSVDRSIGRLLDDVDDTVFVVFYTIDEMVPDSLENARGVLLPEFLYRWNFPGKAALAEGVYGEPVPPPRLDYAAHWKHEMWNLHTPWGARELESPAVQEAREDSMNWCPANWYAPMWPAMRAFAFPSLADGYVRINVQGRETQGIVSEADFGDVCDQLTAAISTMVNARTGKPMVRDVIRVRQTPFDDDPKKPPADLIVVFAEDGPVDVVDSPHVGRIGPIPYFRSGGHQAHDCPSKNVLYVSGPGVPAGQSPRTAQLEDIPATILTLLGLDLPAHFDGVSQLP
ncbi:alkaline phosphatase family protein [Emcibacter sp. SYSU 3D8]|uniref:alkaline phosphatase family protein n=1 Tax=Emcibacter sp. SYSU 3D8 TaxID=3133969 RepID=UPI0031FEF5F2